MTATPGPLRGRPSVGALGTFDGEDELAAAFADFARSAEQQRDQASTLDEIVRAAVELIPGCDDGSISVVLGRTTVSSQAASSELAAVVDGLQERCGQGPCLDAAYVHETVRVSDLATESRWPAFTPQALAAGVAGCLTLGGCVSGPDSAAPHPEEKALAPMTTAPVDPTARDDSTAIRIVVDDQVAEGVRVEPRAMPRIEPVGDHILRLADAGFCDHSAD